MSTAHDAPTLRHGRAHGLSKNDRPQPGRAEWNQKGHTKMADTPIPSKANGNGKTRPPTWQEVVLRARPWVGGVAFVATLGLLALRSGAQIDGALIGALVTGTLAIIALIIGRSVGGNGAAAAAAATLILSAALLGTGCGSGVQVDPKTCVGAVIQCAAQVAPACWPHVEQSEARPSDDAVERLSIEREDPYFD